MSSGHSRIAELLIQHGANPNVVNQHGHSALHRAVVKENKKLVDVLLKAGADVNQLDNQNRTVLHISAKKGSMQIGVTQFSADPQYQSSLFQNC